MAATSIAQRRVSGQPATAYPSARYTVVKKNFAEGGEAIIDLVRNRSGKTLVLKRFRDQNDPVYVTQEQKKAARVKLDELASKLAEFPKLPIRVIAPLKTIITPDKKVFGYTMEYIDHSFQLLDVMSREGRAKHGLSLNQVTEIFLDLYDTITALHARGVVIGDLKPENILIRNLKPYIIDAESMQFGAFACHAYSDEWIDPRLCKAENDVLVKTTPADTASDWYAFTSMFFNAITGITPYAGTAFTQDGMLSETARKMKGISVFAKGVRTPPFALKPAYLHADLARYCKEVFSNARVRDVPKREMFESLLWKTCEPTQREYSSATCPCGKCAEVSGTQRGASFSPTISVAEFPVEGRVVATSLSPKNTLDYLQHSKDEGKILRGPSKSLGKLKDSCAYSGYWLSESAALFANKDSLFIKRGKKVSKVELAAGTTPSIPRVAVYGDTAAVVTPKGASLLDLSTGTTAEILENGKHIKGVWLDSSSTGIGVEVTPDNRIAIRPMVGKQFLESQDVPELVGELVAAKVYYSASVYWAVLRVNDRDEVSDYLFCYDARTHKPRAFCKTEEPLIDDFFEGALACRSAGEEYLYSRYNSTHNAYQMVGSKVLPRHVEPLPEIGDTSIALSSKGKVFVFNPVWSH